MVQDDPGLVVFIWAATAALVGLAIGVLRSFTAACLGLAGGAIGGAAGGFVHSITTAEFDNRTLVLEAHDPQILLLATVVAAMMAFTISFALRTARSGSLTVIEGTGAGTTIDFHKQHATLGGAARDTLVIAGAGLPKAAVRIRLTDSGGVATASVPVGLDGVSRNGEFPVAHGEILAVGGVFVRLELPRGRA